jgi:hypothetical protein
MTPGHTLCITCGWWVATVGDQCESCHISYPDGFRRESDPRPSWFGEMGMAWLGSGDFE